MSGHSKWHNIQATKNKADAARGKIFTKIGREIAVAVKMGGADPNNNASLRAVIAKAKQNNMPNDNITRSIKKASGELGNVNYEEITYEGYGVGGSALIVKCLTDNKNRTAGDVRHAFDKHGGSLGAVGCVGYLFDTKGVLILENKGIDEEKLIDMCLEAEAEDVINDGDVFQIITSPSDFAKVKEALEGQGLNFISAEVTMIPQSTIDLPESQFPTFEKLLDTLEDLDDVQDVYHNVNLPEEAEEE
ncbi:MAG: YebC/PmpR family DNA-binding transcriptional regulator [Christensenellales bacterium]